MLQKASTELQGTYNRLAPGAEQGITGAQSLVNRNLAGGSIQANPFLEGIIAKTRGNVMDSVNSGFAQAGQSALGGRRAQILSRELADSENALRYQDYGTERAYQREDQQAAIGQSQDLMRGSQSLLENSTMLPYAGVSALNGNVRQASAGYGSTTSNSTRKESGDPLGAIMGLGGLGLKAFSTFSDDRMKENIKPVGMLPDGVGVFNYNFKGEQAPRMGVLASDVAAKRPDALGPQVGGMQTVDYGALGPEGAMLAKSAGPVEGMGGALPNLTAPKIESSFNMAGGTRDKLGELGDLLLAYVGNPIGVAGLQAKAQGRQSEQAEAMYARRRADENADWQARADYERANKAPQTFEANNGDRYTMGPDGKPVKVFTDPTPKTTWVEADDGRGGKRLIPFVNGQPMGQGAATPQVGAVVSDPRKAGGNGGMRPFDAVVAQESGGRAGVTGPQTRYGRAQGLAQLLPETAREQAGKLGIAWRPELMTGTTPEAAAYQRQLGESYFNEGLKRTGNMRDALRYYHGGPSRSMWGPKTNRYADQVLGRMGAS